MLPAWQVSAAEGGCTCAGMPQGATLDELATKMGAQSSVPVQVQLHRQFMLALLCGIMQD